MKLINLSSPLKRKKRIMDDFSRYERKISFMKKSTKIILPALALLVLGTTAAATGTVAWFAANGVVSATGMEVQCDVSKNLLIVVKISSSNSSGDFPSKISLINILHRGIGS